MYRFQCDYTEGAHPAIMQRMVETNFEQTNGYGLDPYCDSARKKIKDLCECQEADVHFLVGGTQTNTTVISAALRPYQGAVAAVSGHINALIHIPTLEGLAYNLCGITDIVCPIMDARRGQVYAGIYEFKNQEIQVLEDQMAVPIEELGEKLKKYLKEGRRVTFLGDGVPVHKTKLTEEILPGENITFAPANMNRQRAASVGTLGMQYYKAGKTESAIEHQPDYLRVSQAERERKERLGHV